MFISPLSSKKKKKKKKKGKVPGNIPYKSALSSRATAGIGYGTPTIKRPVAMESGQRVTPIPKSKKIGFLDQFSNPQDIVSFLADAVPIPPFRFIRMGPKMVRVYKSLQKPDRGGKRASAALKARITNVAKRTNQYYPIKYTVSPEELLRSAFLPQSKKAILDPETVGILFYLLKSKPARIGADVPEYIPPWLAVSRHKDAVKYIKHLQLREVWERYIRDNPYAAEYFLEEYARNQPKPWYWIDDL